MAKNASAEAVIDAEAAADAADLNSDPAFFQERQEPDGDGLGDALQKAADDREEPTDKKPTDKKPDAKEALAEEPTDPLDIALSGKKPDEKKPDAEEDPTKAFEGAEKEARGDNVKKNIVNMRTMIGEQFGTIRKLRTELDEAKKTGGGKADPAILKELETARAEAKQLREAIVAIDVKESPEYRSKFVDGRKNLVSKAASRVKTYGGKEDAFQEALSMPEGRRRTEALKEAMADIEETDRPRIYSLVEQIQNLDDEAADTAQNPGQAMEKYDAGRREARAKQEEQMAGQRKEAFGRVAKDLGERSPFLRTLDPAAKGATDWNKDVQGDIEAGFALFSPDTPFETLAEASIKYRAYDRVEKIAITERAARKEAEKKLAEYENAAPGLKGTRRTTGDGDEKDEDLPLGERMQRKADARDSSD